MSMNYRNMIADWPTFLPRSQMTSLLWMNSTHLLRTNCPPKRFLSSLLPPCIRHLHRLDLLCLPRHASCSNRRRLTRACHHHMCPLVCRSLRLIRLTETLTQPLRLPSQWTCLSAHLCPQHPQPQQRHLAKPILLFRTLEHRNIRIYPQLPRRLLFTEAFLKRVHPPIRYPTPSRTRRLTYQVCSYLRMKWTHRYLHQHHHYLFLA